MPRYSSKIGDVFCVPLNNGTKKYFQYIVSDMTCLNSSVIRIFKKFYTIDENPDLNNIINDTVDFYVHVVIQWGVKLKFWEKVGNVADVGKTDVLFKSSHDFIRKKGEPRIEISEKWSVWKINEPMQFVGKLERKYHNAEIGGVVPAYQIIERMRTGKYNMTYPGYDENSILTYIPFEEAEKAQEAIRKAIEENFKKMESRKKKKRGNQAE
jgi:hypothetical protein